MCCGGCVEYLVVIRIISSCMARYIIVGESVRSAVLRRVRALLSNGRLGAQPVVNKYFRCFHVKYVSKYSRL
jgi:hypothetical protein